MSRLLITIIAAMVSIFSSGQGFTNLWKQVEEAEDKDLPKQKIEVLDKITKKAEKEKAYGQLLKAELQTIQTKYSISPDSLLPDVKRLEAKIPQAEKQDKTLAAVYKLIVGRIYQINPGDGKYTFEVGSNPNLLGDNAKDIADQYISEALSDPAMLAAHKDKEYVPFVETGYDSYIFDNDLLSVMGYEVEKYDILHDYYDGKNRKAALITALKMLEESDENYIARDYKKTAYYKSLDSLIAKYGDLDECGEAAIMKYNYIHRCGAEPKEKYEWLNHAISKWGKWKRINELKNRLKDITNPNFSLHGDDIQIILPGKNEQMKLTARHLKEITVNIYRLDYDGALNDEKININSEGGRKKIYQKIIKDTKQTVTHKLPDVPEYQTTTHSITLPELQPGVYLIEAQADNSALGKDIELIYCTSLKVVAQKLSKNETRYAVLDAKTGGPVQNAKLRIYPSYQNEKFNVYECNSEGEITIQGDGKNWDYYNKRVFPYTETDKFHPKMSLNANFYFDRDNRDEDEVRIFTDRSIYRPGQKVYAAIMAFTTLKHRDAKVIQNKAYTLTLRDANNKIVEEKRITTDSYGKASTEFTLPKTGLTGIFTLTTYHAQTSINVEEYKRPTFDVEIEDYKDKYNIGDTIALKGKAKTYSGVPVQGAKVKYTITRRKPFWWWWDGNVATEISEEETTTDDNGEFLINMPLTLEPEDQERIAMGWHCFYNITAEAQVTDIQGETHSAHRAIPLSSKPTYFTSDMPKQQVKSKLTAVTFSLINMAGENMDGETVEFQFDNGQKFTAKTGETKDIKKAIQTLKSGKHTLTATCGDDKIEHEFVVFSEDDKKAPIETDDWYYVSNTEFPKDGAPVIIQAGTSRPETHILYTILSGENKIIETGTIDKQGEILNRKLKYKEEYGDGITMTLLWVKEGKAYAHDIKISKPLPDKKLIMKWQTFRNKLQPGQKEEWMMTVETSDGKPADASVMAALYDKSLDQIKQHSWSLNLGLYRNLPDNDWTYIHGYGMTLQRNGRTQYSKVEALTFSHFCEIDDFSFFRIRRRMFLGGARPMAMAKMANRAVVADDADMMDIEANEMVAESKAMVALPAPGSADIVSTGFAAEEADESAEEQTDITPRTNFAETAFFYPTLMTDEKGNVKIAFTLPESVTTWKLITLANDKEMRNAILTDEAVAQKTIMVEPNMPRFIRCGDDASISTRIANTSETPINGTARIQIDDAETMETVFSQSQNFQLGANATTAATFDIGANTLKPGKLYTVKITAQGSGYSDGEIRYLAVMPDKQRVTKTVPFTQTEPGTKTIDIKALTPATAEGDKLLTIEYTNNPMWLAIQALPTVAIGCDKNAASLASSYYANKIADFVIKQSPNIKTTIQQWEKEEQENPESSTLQSALETNEELKELLLDETPWVAEAKHENEQKHQLINYFDDNQINSRLNTTLAYLKKLQGADGSWSWWPGMRGSLYITLYVTETMARLNTLAGKQDDTKEMMNRAFKFLDGEMVKWVEEMKKLEKKGFEFEISRSQIDYLYTLALEKREPTGKAADAKKYLLDKLLKMPRKTDIQTKALTAVVLAHNNHKKMAEEYLQSIEEYTVYTEEMGRYYDSPNATYSWCDYRIPTQTAAMEALTLIGKDKEKTIDEMRRWLIQEKRTQGWLTPINAVNAVYALINGNTQSLDTKEMTKLAIDGKQLDTPKSTAGLGYVKTTADAENAQTFTAEKTSEGMSWGVLYLQFYQPTTDVDDMASGITVTRTIVEGNDFKVGDKVTVRIDIKADRDYDFVTVSDRRAACMEPLQQLSTYRWGYYISTKDNTTNYYFDCLSKGSHRIETEYYIDRKGTYTTGTCEAQCTYSPGYKATAKALKITVK